MNRPDISVIIPYYNAAPYLERAARSLLAQTLGQRLETVWVDDGSTDGSAALLQRILSENRAGGPTAIALSHAHNRGSAAARLTGLKAATGRYIIFCDADDYVETDAYEAMLHTAEANGADMVVCDYAVEHGKQTILHSGVNDDAALTEELLCGKAHAGLCNKLTARHLFDRIGQLWIEGIDMWEDAWTTTRLAHKASKTVHLPRPLYHYVSNPQSYTGRFSDKSISDMLTVTGMLDRYFADTTHSTLTVRLKRRARALALYYGSADRRRQARSLWPDVPYRWLDLNDGLPMHQRAVAFCAAYRCLTPAVGALEFIRRLAGGR